MTEQIRDTVNWGVATGITLGVAGAALKGVKRLTSPPRRRTRPKRRKR